MDLSALESMNFFDVTTFAVGVSSLTCLAAKAVCLIWAFIRTQRPAALVYLVFLILNGLLPVVLAYTVSPESYASAWLLVGVGGVVIETGLSDFHKMSLTVMKVFYKKQKSNIIEYRDYRNFDNDFFMADLRDQISKIGYQNVVLNFDLFKKTADRMLHKHIPLKKRYVRANEAPFMNKKIKKEIMKRSLLKEFFKF